MNTAIFNDIQIGKSFTMFSKITYQKVSATEAKPTKDSKGVAIANGLVTTAFYNSNITMTLIN